MLSQFDSQKQKKNQISHLNHLKFQLYNSIIAISVDPRMSQTEKLSKFLKLAGSLVKTIIDLKITQGFLSAQDPLVINDQHGLVIYNSVPEEELLNSDNHYSFISGVIYRLGDSEATYVMTLCAVNNIRYVLSQNMPLAYVPTQYFMQPVAQIPSMHQSFPHNGMQQAMALTQNNMQMMPSSGAEGAVSVGFEDNSFANTSASSAIQSNVAGDQDSSMQSTETRVIEHQEIKQQSLEPIVESQTSSTQIESKVAPENKEEVVASESIIDKKDKKLKKKEPKPIVKEPEMVVTKILQREKVEVKESKPKEEPSLVTKPEDLVVAKISKSANKEPKAINITTLIHDAVANKKLLELHKFLEEHPEQTVDVISHIQGMLNAKKTSGNAEYFIQNIKLSLVDLKKLTLKKANSLKSIIQRKISLLENDIAGAKLKLDAESKQQALRVYEDRGQEESLPVIQELVLEPKAAVIVNISLKDKVKTTVNTLNTAAFNELLSDNPKRKKDIYDALALNLCDKIEIPRSFIEGLTLSSRSIIDMIESHKKINILSKYVLLLILYNNLLNNDSMVEYEEYNKIITAQMKSFEDVDINNYTLEYLELWSDLNYAWQSLTSKYHAWIASKIKSEFEYLENLTPYSSIKNKALKYAYCSTNAAGESLLLVALRKNLSLSTLVIILEQTSDKTLLAATIDKENVMHYWAKHLCKNSLSYMKPLFGAVIAAFKRSGANIAKAMISDGMIDNDGNTFLHTLFSSSDKAALFDPVFAELAKNQNYTELLACGLVPNKNKDTVYSIVDCKTVPRPEVLYRIRDIFIAAAFRVVATMPKDDSALFFASNDGFYTNKSILGLLERLEYSTLIDTLKCRYGGQRVLLDKFPQLTFNLTDKQAEKKIEKYDNMIRYFATEELKKFCIQNIVYKLDGSDLKVVLQTKEVPLLTIMIDTVIAVRYPETRQAFNMVLDMGNMREITVKRTDAQLYKDCVALEKTLSEDFPFDEASKEVNIANQMSWKVLLLFASVNNLSNLPDMHRSKLMAHEYRHLSDADGVLRGLDLAVELQTFPVIKYLAEELLSPVMPRTICAAFSGQYLELDLNKKNPNANDQIMDYLLNKYIERFKKRNGKPLLDDEAPLLHGIISSWFGLNFEYKQFYMALFERVLDKKNGENEEIVATFLAQKNIMQSTPIMYLFSILLHSESKTETPQIYELMNLFLDRGAPYLDVGHNVSGSILFYCLIANDLAILNLFVERILKDHPEKLPEILAIKNSNGMTVLELSEYRMRETHDKNGNKLTLFLKNTREELYTKLKEVSDKFERRVVLAID